MNLRKKILRLNNIEFPVQGSRYVKVKFPTRGQHHLINYAVKAIKGLRYKTEGIGPAAE